MKFGKDKNLLTISIYAFFVLAAAIVFNMLIGNITALYDWLHRIVGFIQPVIYGFAIAFLLSPTLRFFEKKALAFVFRKHPLKPKTQRGIALLLTYICALLLIAIFISIIVPQVFNSLTTIVSSAPSYLKSLNILYTNIITELEEFQLLGEGDETNLLKYLAETILGAIENIFKSLGEWTNKLMSGVFQIAAQFTSAVIDLILGVIISIYFLLDREKLFAQINKICHALLPQKACILLRDIVADASRVFNGFVTGKIIDSVIIGIICYIGLRVFKISDEAMLISLIVGITNVIPYFGPFIGAIPGFLLTFLTDPLKSLFFLIFILALQQFDGNILGPKILGDTTGLSAFWVIFSIMLFSGLFGVVGMFIGVPLFAVIYTLIKRFVSYLLRRKNLSVDTRSYASKDNPMIK